MRYRARAEAGWQAWLRQAGPLDHRLAIAQTGVAVDGSFATYSNRDNESAFIFCFALRNIGLGCLGLAP